MENKQLFEKRSNSYNPFFPLVRLEDIIETISDKSIQWILNNYNHIYVEYSESTAITRNKVPALLRRSGLWITYNVNKEIITEYYKGDNKDVQNYLQWTMDDNWERFDKIKHLDGSITYQHLSEAVKQLLGSGNTITNYPDDEDLTVKGGTLKLKDRDYDVANFSGLGRIILRKNIMVIDKKLKNILTQDMIDKENTIYEIRYDFDLNGAEITIPEGCVLDFQGGSLSNGSIVGNNTFIISNNKNIFNYNRKSQYIKGSWQIKEWNCSWFGLTDDGSSTELDDGTLKFEGTDNYEPIQKCLDCAFFTNVKNVYIPKGKYRITKSLNIGWWAQHSIVVSGENNIFGAESSTNWNYNCPSTVILYDGTEYAININSGINSSINNIYVVGINGNFNSISGQNSKYSILDKINDTYYYNKNKYMFNGVLSKIANPLDGFRPYAGIVTDIFMNYDISKQYTAPDVPYLIANDQITPTFSRGFTMNRVRVSGFGLGLGLSLTNNDIMGDYYKFYDCIITANVYGIGCFNINSRLTSFYNCRIENNFCAVTNKYFGKSSEAIYRSGYGFSKFYNCGFDHNFMLIDIYNQARTTWSFDNCYSEYPFLIGKTDGINNPQNVKFIDCNIKFGHSSKNPNGIPFSIFYGDAMFIRTNISEEISGTPSEHIYSPILISIYCRSSVFDNCKFIINSRGYYNKSCSLFLPYSSNSNLHISTNTPGNFNVEEIEYLSYFYLNNKSEFKYKHNRILTSIKDIENLYYDTVNNELFIYCILPYGKGLCVGDIAATNSSDGDIWCNRSIFVITEMKRTEGESGYIRLKPILGYFKNEEFNLFSKNISLNFYSTRSYGLGEPVTVNKQEYKVLYTDGNISKIPLGSEIISDYCPTESLHIEDNFVLQKEDNKIHLLSNVNNIDKNIINGVRLPVNKNPYWYKTSSEKTYIQDLIDENKVNITVKILLNGKEPLANTNIAFVDVLKNIVDVSSTDSSGVITITLPKHQYRLESKDYNFFSHDGENLVIDAREKDVSRVFTSNIKPVNNSNEKFGLFEDKPNYPFNGASYFCTDRQTVEGGTNGIMIYHKGNNVWVDGLGRIVE